MRNSLETYKVWAPEDSLWAQWTKPVLFAENPRVGDAPLELPSTEWFSLVDYNTMIVVDLPGEEGVLEGLALAQRGYRPVPLYNGVSGPNFSSSIVDVRDIAAALYRGADMLAEMHLRPNAPPVFLLDSRRMQGQGKRPDTYDNRWCVFPQDMPSAAYLSQHGIRRVLLRTPYIQNDLSHVLCRYQKQGIRMFQQDDTHQQREITLMQPSRFRSLQYRFRVITGLTRNAAGGFGAKIPEQMQSDSGIGYGGYHHHRFG